MGQKTMVYTAADVMQLLNVSESMAYKIIRQLNAELAEDGYITVRGKVSKKYFMERMF